MKNKMMKSFLCLALSAAMIVGEAGTVFAGEPVSTVAEETESEDTTELSTETTEVSTEVTTESTEVATESTETTEPTPEVVAPEVVAPVAEAPVVAEPTEVAEPVVEEPAENVTDSEEAIADVAAEEVAETTGAASLEFDASDIDAYSTTVDGVKKVHLYWNYAHAEDANGYYVSTTYTVYRSDKRTSGFKAIATLKDTSSYTTDIKTSGDYYYCVVASAAGLSATSATVGVRFYTPVGVVNSTDLDLNNLPKITYYSSGEYDTDSSITEYICSMNITGYEVYRSSKKTSGYKKIATTVTTEYKDKTAKSGKTYYYKVKPISYDAATGKTTKGAFSEPEGFKIILNYIEQLEAKMSSSTKVKLTWDKLKGASSYEISMKSDLTGDAYKVVKTTSKNSFTKSGLAKDTGYNFVVRAYVVKNGVKTYYTSSSVSVSTGFSAPRNAVISKQTTSATATSFTSKSTIKWDKVYGATGYRVYGYKNGDKVLIATTKKNTYTLSQTVSTTNGQYYSYVYIAAYKGSKESDTTYLSSYAKPTKKDGEYVYDYKYIRPYLASVKPTVKKASATSAKVSWKKVTGATSYTVYREAAGSSYYVGETTALTLEDKELTVGVAYTYYVTPHNYSINALNSYSSSDLYKTEYTLGVTKPSVSVANTSSKKAVLTIKDSTKLAKSFVIYRATSKKGTYKKIATVKAKADGTATYTNSKLTKNKTYYYKVEATVKNQVGESVASSKTSAKSIKIKK